MLLLRERHTLRGQGAEAFAARFRDAWVPALSGTPGASLYGYFDQAHGAGPSYTVVTYTQLADLDAWAGLDRRTSDGDLAELAHELDAYRERVDASLLAPLAWSPREAPRAPRSAGTDGPTQQPLYLEDTVWPHPGSSREYVRQAGDVYRPALDRGAHRLLTIELALRPLLGAGRQPEVRLLQRVDDAGAFVAMLARPTPPERRRPGTWMHDALALRDRWSSRLLRAAPWSPLPAEAPA